MTGLVEFLIGGGPAVLYLIVSAALIASVLLVSWMIKSEADSPVRPMKRRLEELERRGRGLTQPNSPSANVRRLRSDSSIQVFDKALKRLMPRPALMRQRLAKTGFNLSIGEYVMISLIVGVLAAGLTHYFFDAGILLSLLAGVACGLGLPHILVSFLIARRRSRFIANFPEAVELIVRGLKSGLPVAESVRTVAEEIPNPVGVEFADIASNIKLGRTMDEAMWVASRRIDTPEFKFFVISLSVQKETGGNLAETLENLADILRRRRQMKLKIRALSSEARASAYIIGSLPFMMFGIIYLLNRGYAMELFNDPRGHIMLGVGFIMLAIGIGTMIKMVRFEI